MPPRSRRRAAREAAAARSKRNSLTMTSILKPTLCLLVMTMMLILSP